MKKWTILAMAMLVMLAVLVPAAMAQGPVATVDAPQTGYGVGQMNQSGTCDNFVDEDGDGVCDLAGSGQGQGSGDSYVDEDGDGVCDNAGTNSGQSQQQSRGGRR